MIKTGSKPTFTDEARRPMSTAERSEQDRKGESFAGRRGRASAGSAGAAQLLKDRLALPVREVAGLLGISSAAVRLMIARGDLPGRKIGGGRERVTFIIPTAALVTWLEGAPRTAADGAA